MTAREPEPGWQIAECLLPGLTLPAAEELAQRITAELASRPRPGVSFLGSLLMPATRCCCACSPARGPTSWR